MILDLCRAWGQPPAWWASLSREDQATLLGYWRAQGPARSAARVNPRVTVKGAAARQFWGIE